jgi:hypothetical protein
MLDVELIPEEWKLCYRWDMKTSLLKDLHVVHCSNFNAFELDFLVGSRLIDMYTTYRSVEDTWRVFNNMANNLNSSTARIPDNI